MSAPDVIVTAPLPPFLYDPLKRDFRCHDYHQSAQKGELLAAESPRIRGLVQGGGTVTPSVARWRDRSNQPADAEAEVAVRDSRKISR